MHAEDKKGIITVSEEGRRFLALISFVGPGGTTVVVEAADADLAQPADESSTSEVSRGLRRRPAGVVPADRTLEDALEVVRPAVSAVTDLMHAVSPDEWEVTFGITLSAQVGAFIARGAVGGNFQVRMTWKSTKA